MSNSSTEKPIATYTRMADGTKEDYFLLQEHSNPRLNQVADRALTLLVGLQESYPVNLIFLASYRTRSPC
ncbi:hypothetical protein [Nostoc sp.]|uniref:hypothetical protein n=1 Tax=Nostoc sp. TaxID=1180 RepID=UPI002FF47DC9